MLGLTVIFMYPLITIFNMSVEHVIRLNLDGVNADEDGGWKLEVGAGIINRKAWKV